MYKLFKILNRISRALQNLTNKKNLSLQNLHDNLIIKLIDNYIALFTLIKIRFYKALNLFKIIFYFVFITNFLPVYSNFYNINGFVKDSVSGEVLIGVNVYFKDMSAGTITNNYGFYSLQTIRDTAYIIFSYIGYQKKTIEVIRGKSVHSFNILLAPGENIDEVTIYASQTERRIGTSIIKIPIKDVMSFPSISGEPDVINSLKLLPGVQTGLEGTSDFYIRGGEPAQNLILLDDIPLYYTSHLGGFLSVIDPSSVKSINLKKGNFPAKYGGRLSSVLDIRLKDGNLKKYHGIINIGILSSKLSFEGPIKKDKSSFIISTRRFNYDLLSNLFFNILYKNTTYKQKQGYTFYDVNIKINQILNEKNRLFLNLYKGRDKLFMLSENKNVGLTEERNFSYLTDWSNKWGNFLTSIRWNHVFNNNIFNNTTFYYSKYYFGNNYFLKRNMIIDNSVLEYKENEFYSTLDDYTTKADFECKLNKHFLCFGTSFTYRKITPGNNNYKFYKQNSILEIDTTITNPYLKNIETSLYFSDEIIFNSYFTLFLGLRPSIFITNERQYFNLQPRINIQISPVEDINILASYTLMDQSIHLLSNSEIGIPYNIWLPATSLVEPEKARQYTIGITKILKNWGIEVSLEGYLKKLWNQTLLKEGELFIGDPGNWENKIETKGEGYSKGMEFYLKKETKNFKGWISYSLSKSERLFKNVNNGDKFRHTYDRPHNLIIALSYKINTKFVISTDWKLSSGSLITNATDSYNTLTNYLMDTYFNEINYNLPFEEEFQIVNSYSKKNNFRLPPYHRLNINFTYKKEKKRGTSDWSLNIYNVYNHKNPFFIFYEVKNGTIKYYKFCLFPIIPTINYTYSF